MRQLLRVFASALVLGSLPVADIVVAEPGGGAVEATGAELSNATFAGGCFWCTEAVFEGRRGVGSVVSGFAGGSKQNATYERVLTGETGHREAVRVRYDSSEISYRELLDIYWRSIDPTDGGGQFTDRGFQYTTAIYYHDGRQRELALESRSNISEDLEEPVQTEVLNYTTFFEAADRHQNYSRRNTVRYEIYKQGSGRENVLERLWGETAFDR